MTARYIMIGGFLGAGKTTALLAFARWLHARGHAAGLITNDQGSALVDTRLLSGAGFAVEEIAGGCLCCRFQSLVEAAERLRAEEAPDVLLAEPVGSCTDLVATVALPLRRLYGDAFRVAPVSVMLDPFRARRILELDAGARFSDKVRYLYRKQLEEADALVINKADRLDAAARDTLRAALREAFPEARQFVVSAREGTGLERWFHWLLETGQPARTAMEVDYAAYAEGEARLGWLNAGYRLEAVTAWDGNAFLRELGEILRAALAPEAEIAHLKMTLEATGLFHDVAVLNLVQNDAAPELAFTLEEPLRAGCLTLNLRAEAAPDRLADLVRQGVETARRRLPCSRFQEEHLQFFRPARPTPTHRDAG
jgi:Ni2+-binding GTPase involved in maturation of urease and hydrogenase